ncbi:MAG TPA: HNH endonuclease [Motilibacteraceae bacterium]|nr:HNH endonuclease [Motilibacteraceae bacterium]
MLRHRLHRTPSQTTAHHLDHWADDGPTSLGNSAPLCGHEHWLVHEGGWDIRRSAEPGVVEWRPGEVIAAVLG